MKTPCLTLNGFEKTFTGPMKEFLLDIYRVLDRVVLVNIDLPTRTFWVFSEVDVWTYAKLMWTKNNQISDLKILNNGMKYMF